jgi:hypothetical protein
MPTLSPEAAVAARICSVLGSPWVQPTGSPPTNGNVFLGPVRPGETVGIPHKAIFCMPYGGAPPEPYLGGASADSFFRPRVQVLVRSDPQKHTEGLATARAVSAALNKAALSGYLDAQLIQSDPNYLTQDKNGCHQWSVNVELRFVGANVPA